MNTFTQWGGRKVGYYVRFTFYERVSVKLYLHLGWWFGVGFAVDRAGVTLWLPGISMGVDW